MTLKEELEILRGEPIEVFTGDPMDIPCIETSDPEKLCKHPVVSVYMITYNHEPYIRQAIEGVMMQKTDFEFELIIGEDCSQDKTREICFEYQKKYPDKIRVLWWHENVSKLGGNGRRCRARCRGEFIALCEGDDYWIDPLKLQKQVDVMRKHPNVGFCFCGSKRYFQNENRFDVWDDGFATYKPGIQHKESFFASFLMGMPPGSGAGRCDGFIMTATTMIRRCLYERIVEKYAIFSWRLRLGDATLWLGASSLMDGYFLADSVSVYRIANTGVFQNPQTRVGVQIDGVLVRLYYFSIVWKINLCHYPFRNLFWLIDMVGCKKGPKLRCRYLWSLRGVETIGFTNKLISLPYVFFAFIGMDNKVSRYLSFGMINRFASRRWAAVIMAHFEETREDSALRTAGQKG